jgi:tetratricopeptide (TPR) repeat protein
LNKAIEINPKYAMAYYNRGIPHSNKGQYDKAIADYTKAIELNPKYAGAYVNRGYVFNKIGQKEKACSDWKRACQLGDCSFWTINKIRCSGK